MYIKATRENKEKRFTPDILHEISVDMVDMNNYDRLLSLSLIDEESSLFICHHMMDGYILDVVI